jgi:uncharacterized protein
VTIFKTFFCLLPCALLICSCTSVFYYPTAYRYTHESLLQPPPQEIYLHTNSAKDLLSWYFESPESQRLPVSFVFAHGNAQNISAHYRSLHWITEHGLSYLIVGYPGYGPNSGKPSPQSTVESVVSAIQWIKKNRPDHRIVLLGQSLGGNVILRALTKEGDQSICAVVIEGSFSSYQRVAQKTLAKHWLTWPLQWLSYLLISDNESIMAHKKALKPNSYLVIHGDQDQAVPFAEGQKLYEMLPDDKAFWRIEGGQHIDTFARHPEFKTKFISFIKAKCTN